MSGAGNSLRTISECEWLEAGNLKLPFMICSVENAVQPTFVYYCLWDDRASHQSAATVNLTYGNRLATVFAGLRNPGQRSLEILLSGQLDEPTARLALQNELKKIIRVAPSTGN